MSEIAPVPHILVVDDDTEVRYSLPRALIPPILGAGSRERRGLGVAAVKKQPPDLVLLDIRMTGMGGIEALQHIRSANRSSWSC
jgi:CheY-like chemotaxis protein